MAIDFSQAGDAYFSNQKKLREAEYFRSLYPPSLKKLQKYVAEECDTMDYKGSPMYDECPEVMVMEKACRRICDRIPDSVINELAGADSMAVEGKAAAEVENESGGDDFEDEEVMEEVVEGVAAELNETADMKQQQAGCLFPGCQSGPPFGRPPQGPPPGRPPQVPPPWGPPPGRPPQAPPPWGPPPGRPPKNQPSRPWWLRDMVAMLLADEMQERRCRAGC